MLIILYPMRTKQTPSKLWCKCSSRWLMLLFAYQWAQLQHVNQFTLRIWLKKNWKQTSCTDNSESYTVFGKYFNILHSSAESLRAAKDTQHPTGAKQRDGSSLCLSFARKREREISRRVPQSQKNILCKEGNVCRGKDHSRKRTVFQFESFLQMFNS